MALSFRALLAVAVLAVGCRPAAAGSASTVPVPNPPAPDPALRHGGSPVVTLPAVTTPAATTRTTTVRPPAPDATACPLKTPSDWQNFLNAVAAQDELVDTCELGDCDQDFHDHIQTTVADVLTACDAAIKASPQITKCTENLRSYIPTWLVQHDRHGYGFTIDNHAYNAREDGPDAPPGMMTVPQALINALPNAARFEKAARANGWKYIVTDSMIDQGKRTFVFMPDPDGYYDKWMLLNLEDGDVVDTTNPVSFIAVQKKDAQGHVLPKVRLNFRDYFLERSPVGYDLVTHDDAGGKCYACHVSGMRRLIERETVTMRRNPALPVKGDPEFAPDNKPDPAFALKRLKELNARLTSYGMNDWDGMIKVENHGPVLGGDQGCTDCHDDATRGALRMSTSVNQLWEKAYYQLAMPPEPGLQDLLQKRLLSQDDDSLPQPTADEDNKLDKAITSHHTLIQELDDSRYPILKQWLLQTSCQ